MAVKVKKATATSESESNFLSVPGVYHLGVASADESPSYKDRDTGDDVYIEGFRFQFEVLAGPEAKKTIGITFRDPKDDSKDGGEFAATKQTRILEILGLIPYDRTEDQEGIEVELVGPNGEQLLLGRQLIAEFKRDGKFLDLDGLKFWHIDDPNAPKCERNQSMIDRIPKGMRRDASTFPKKKEAAPATGNGKPAPQRKVDVDGMGSKKAPPAPAAGDDLDI